MALAQINQINQLVPAAYRVRSIDAACDLLGNRSLSWDIKDRVADIVIPIMKARAGDDNHELAGLREENMQLKQKVALQQIQAEIKDVEIKWGVSHGGQLIFAMSGWVAGPPGFAVTAGLTWLFGKATKQELTNPERFQNEIARWEAAARYLVRYNTTLEVAKQALKLN